MTAPWEAYAKANESAAPWEQYADTGERALPKGVIPSAAGAGRGFVNPPMASEIKPERTWKEAATDTTRSLAQGLIDVGGTLPGVAYGAVTGDYDNAWLNAARGMNEIIDQDKSESIKDRREALQKKINSAEGWREKFAVGGIETILDPVLAADTVARSAPGMLAGGVIGRGAGAVADAAANTAIKSASTMNSPLATAGLKVAQAAPSIASGTAVGGAGAIQGASVASDTYEEAMKLPMSRYRAMDGFAELAAKHGEEKAKSMFASQAANRAGAVATAASIASMKLIPGGDAIEKAMLPRALQSASKVAEPASRNVFTKPLTQGFSGGVGSKIAEVAVKGGTTASAEGISEGLEEGSGAVAKTLETSRISGETPSLAESFAEAAGQAAPIGMAMGGATGAMHGGGAQPQSSQEPDVGQKKPVSVADIAKSKGLNLEPTPEETARLKSLQDAGEKSAAAIMQSRIDKRVAADSMGAEAEAMAANNPALATPNFQDQYKSLRVTGIKPVEAAARASVLSTFGQAAQAANLSPEATQAAMQAAQAKDIADLPGFLSRYSQKLSEKGIGQAIPSDFLESARDDAMETAMQSVYAPPAAADILAMEQDYTQSTPQDQAIYDQNTAQPLTKPAQNAIGTIADDLAVLKAERNQARGELRKELDTQIGQIEAEIAQQNQAQTITQIAPAAIESIAPEATPIALDPIKSPAPVLRPSEVKPEPQKAATPQGLRIGMTPKLAEPVTVRNGEIFIGKDQAINFETGNPVQISETATSNQIIQALKDAGALSRRQRIFGNEQNPEARSTGQTQAASVEAPAPIQSDAGAGAIEPTTAASTDVEAPRVAQLGQNSIDLADGGKPFKTKAEADKARKNQPMMRTLRNKEGGYILTEKTAAQLKAQAKRSGKAPSVGKKGVPYALHEFIASRGGLDFSADKEIGIGKNLKIGGGNLYAGKKSIGMTLDQAAELAWQNGYFTDEPTGAEFAAAVKQSLTTPRYTPDGYDRIAEAETQTRFEDYAAAQADAQNTDFDPFPLADDFTSDLREESGYDEASVEQIRQWEALIAQAEADGIDTESIREDIARKQELTDEEYRAAVAEEIANQRGMRAISNEADRATDSEQRRKAAGRGRGEGRSEDAGAQSAQGNEPRSVTKRKDGTLSVKGDPKEIKAELAQAGITNVIASKDGVVVGKTKADEAQELLTAPTREDILSQQDRAENAQALDDKAQIDREASGFTLQAQTQESRTDNTGDMFGGVSVEDYQKAAQRKQGGTVSAGEDLFSQSDVSKNPEKSSASAEPVSKTAKNEQERKGRIETTLANNGYVVGDELRMSNGMTQMKLTPDELAGIAPEKIRAKPNPQDARIQKSEQVNPEMIRAKADLQNALADIADIFGKNTKLYMLPPEQEQKLLPALTRLMDAAFRMGYIKFKDAAKFALDQLRAALGNDIADAVTLDHLQGAYIGMAGSKKGADSKKAVINIEDKAEIEAHTAKAYNAEQEQSNVPDTNSNLERNSGKPATEPAVVRPVQDGLQGADQSTRANREENGNAGRGLDGNPSLSSDSSVIGGERGGVFVHRDDRAARLAQQSAGADFGERGGDSGNAGIQAESIPASTVDQAAEASPARRAEPIKPPAPGLANIRETLPQLLPEQQEDVAKAEERFTKPEGYGMLFTNGTGTGKTFTGLGIIKRFAMRGKDNTLIVVPDDKIASDWIKSGRLLGLSISKLPDTKTAGEGIVITSYANLGENNALVKRNWDLVVPDEAHTLMQSANGDMTGYLENLRAITLHPDGIGQRHRMLHPEEFKELDEINQKIAGNVSILNNDDTMKTMADAVRKENDRLTKRRDVITAKLAEDFKNEKATVMALQGKTRPRLAALSATPFAYEKTIDWANGYIFDYNEGQTSENTESRGYNSGTNRERFFMQNFGYTMRYNKLTEPDGSKVDRGLMQRQFNTMLKQKGVLSGRMLNVKADYDRRFILVDSAIGNRIDAALEWLSDKSREKSQDKAADGKVPPNGFLMLRDAVADKFDYLSRRYLLEAIKAQEAIPIVKAHMEKGRKVVVFHDYKKGGAFHPFKIESPSANAKDKITQERLTAFRNAVAEFNREFKDLVAHPFEKMRSPIDTFKSELPDVMLVNGNEKPADLLKRYEQFQKDDTGPQVMLVQSAKNKGWSGHDTTGKHQRVLINLGQPTAPTLAIQQEGRIYRTGQVSDAIMRYLNTGTNWEKYAFASTIAQRASAAENLGMGEQARALKDSFIQAFEEADAYPPGHEGEGKGGKERDAAINNTVSEFDRAKTFYWATQKKTSKTKASEGVDYFATPEPLGFKMVKWADQRGGENALEPSGGHGAIARWMPETTNRTVIEPSMALRSRLSLAMQAGDYKLIDGVFEDHNIVNKYDTIVMNPPFGSGGKTAVDHLAKAATHLRDGGRIVAIIPTGPAADKKFDKWMYGKTEAKAAPLYIDPNHGPIFKGDTLTLSGFGTLRKIVVDKVDGAGSAKYVRDASTSKDGAVNITAIVKVEPTGSRTEEVSAAEGYNLVADIQLPQSTFERAGTAVATRIVIIDKGDAKGGTQKIDLSNETDISKFFDRIENLNITPRANKDEAAEQSTPRNARAVPAERETAAQPAKAEKPKKKTYAAGDAINIGGKDFTVAVYRTNAGKDKIGVWMDSKEEAAKYSDRPFKTAASGGKWFVDQYYFPKDEPKQDAAFSRSGESPAQTIAKADELFAPEQERRGLLDRASEYVSRLSVDPATGKPYEAKERIFYSRGGVSQAQTQNTQGIVDSVTSKWKDGPQVQVVSTPEDLPIRAPSDARGLYLNGKIYIVASTQTGKQSTLETLAHEAIAHYGMRNMLGKQFDSYMKQINLAAKSGNKAIKAIQDEVRSLYVDDKGKFNLNEREEADEMTARVAQSAVDAEGKFKPGFGFVKSVYAKIVEFLRSLGLNIGLTMPELQGMLVNAQSQMRDGKENGVLVGQAASLSGNIEVDGQQRSRLNSNGKPIASTDEALRNFWRWFGDSKVVDGQGRPMVVYHGTNADFDAFSISEFGKTDDGWYGEGFYFTLDPKKASGYAKGGSVMPAYLSLKNPWYADSPLPDYLTTEKLRRGGSDGVWANAKEDELVAFDSTQIKSATGNNGNFDGSNPDIRLSRAGEDLLSTYTPEEIRTKQEAEKAALKQEQEQPAKAPQKKVTADQVDMFNEQGALFSRAGKAKLDKTVSGKLDEFLSGTISTWHKTVGTMYNIAERHPEFKKVFDTVQDFLGDVSTYATEAADKAPSLLPKLEGARDIIKRAISSDDANAIKAPIFQGTLAWTRDASGKPILLEKMEDQASQLSSTDKAQLMLKKRLISPTLLKMWQGHPIDKFESLIESRYKNTMLKPGVVFSDKELKDIFNLNEKQISLYKEFRESTNTSLDNLTKATMVRAGGKELAPISKTLMEQDLATAEDTAVKYLESLKDGENDNGIQASIDLVQDLADRAKNLKSAGYAPLTRFGEYTATVYVDGEMEYFGMYESLYERAKAVAALRKEFPKAEIKQGTVSKEEHKLLQGITPDTAALFGDMLALDEDSGADKVMQTYLKKAVANQSALKRMIHRKGTAGFNEDAGRVLAAFVYSNARQTAKMLHGQDMLSAAEDIPKESGELKDAATKLIDYIKNPAEEAQALRAMLFTQYIGGSIASAMVNLTQPWTMTLPYLSQHGGITKAAARLTAATALSMQKNLKDSKLSAAIKKAEQEGIVAPQEVHQLMAQASGGAVLKSGDGTVTGWAGAKTSNTYSRLIHAWGVPFSLAEQLNRRVTFIAAYNTAVAEGMDSPEQFARKVIGETQGIYNKGNKPRWARGAVGATLFTFKQFSVSYVEMINRMWNAGEKGSKERAYGRRAAMYSLAVLWFVSGLGGLPGADDLDDVVSAALVAMGYNIQGKMAVKEFMAKLMGDVAAEFMLSGVSGLPGAPLDVSGRLGMGNLLPGTGLIMQKRDHERDVSELFGPAGDMVKRFFDASGKAVMGDFFSRDGAIATASPKAASNMIQAAYMQATGKHHDTKNRTVTEVSGLDAAIKAIGFNPKSVKDVQDKSRDIQRMVGTHSLKKEQIVYKWARAIYDEDDKGADKAIAELDDWNEKNPDLPIKIEAKQIRDRVKAMYESKLDRIQKNAPKSIRAKVAEMAQ